METTLSPIEQAFWDAAKSIIKGLESQQWIDPYRVDFVVQHKRLIIELDGHEYHSSREQRASDAIRQRELQRLGYTVIRYTGSEIYADVNACVKETVEQLKVLPEHEEFLRPKERVRYCVRMRGVITHLLDKFGRDVNNEEFALRLTNGKYYDDLFIQRKGPTISVAHFYFPNKSVALPDPRVDFVAVAQGPEDYEDWAPVHLGQLCQGKKFSKINDDGKFVVIDYAAQHQAAQFAEDWAQVIRIQGWANGSKEVI